MKKLLLPIVILFMGISVAFAQKTVSGNVVDDQGIPLPGATILEQGTTNGVSSDFDGNFSIEVSEGAVLVISFVGYQTQEITVGSEDNISVALEAGNELEEVVVTSLGITREKQALGYAISEVDDTALEQRADGDIGRVLSGKASGVQITNQSGVSGSGTNIIIRGFNTFSGGNQPLFVVDGIPFSSETNAQGNFQNGNNGSSRFLDIDPNNIESVNVLKGLAAATLYGSQGRNGVILITTKAGSTKTQEATKTDITITSSYFNNEMASMPDYQDSYGNGFDQAFGWYYSNWGPSFEEGGIAGWGRQPALNGSTDVTKYALKPGFLKHPFVTASAATGLPAAAAAQGIDENTPYEWKAYDNNRFWNTGTIINNNINISSGSSDGKISYNVNYGNLQDEGFTPGNKLTRDAISFGGRAELSNKFTVRGTLNYTNTLFKAPPISGGGGSAPLGGRESVFSNIFFTPRSVDVMGLPYQHPVTGESTYYRQNNAITHPIWTTVNAKSIQDTHRVFGGATLSYAINDNLNLAYRYGVDTYSEANTEYTNKGGKMGSAVNRTGTLNTWNNVKTITDHNISLSGDYDVTGNIGLTFVVGATSNSQVFDQNGVASTGQQVFNVLRHFNFENQDEIQYYQKRNVSGVYGQAELDYDRFVYLTLAARTDWVSNLSEENRSITYPSASVSFLPTKVFDGLKSDLVNMLKVRVGLGASADFPFGYPIASRLNLDTQSFIRNGAAIVANTSSSQLGNPALKPERMDELEFGIEGTFLNRRLGLDLSIYNKATKDLRIDRPLDPSTGYTTTVTNIGKIENKGAEVDLSFIWVQAQQPGALEWTSNLNWSTNESKVVDLGADTDYITYAGGSGYYNVAAPGYSLGTIVGSAINRDASGNYKVLSNGFYDIKYGTDPEENTIGDATPNFLLNFGNRITYKDFALNFLISHVNGGDIMSMTTSVLLGRGLVEDTVDREQSFILPGVNPSGQPNTTQIVNSDFYFYNVLYGPGENRIYDGSVIRLQEVSLTYNLPKSILDSTPFGSLSLSASGFNLWYDAYNTPDSVNFDPNVAGVGIGNGRGFDWLNGPSSKRYGLSLKATF